MKKNVELSVIVVSYNTRELTRSCLASIARAQTDSDAWEVIVVDNASSDGSVKAISELRITDYELRIIQNKANVGFAVANNQGIHVARGDYILLLNSDTEVSPGSIQSTLTYLKEHDDVGAVTCKVLLPSGSIDPASHRGFPTPWAATTYFLGLERMFPRVPFFSGYHQWYKDLSHVHEIDSPSGAFFMVRKKTIDDVGLLDESYFMYAEDIDWAFRMKQKGWKIMFLPDATILHKKKQSGRGSASISVRRQTDRYFFETMLQFYDKHMHASYPWLVSWLVRAIIKMRLAIVSFGI